MAAGAAAFDFRPSAAIPLFNGHAWFMPVAFAWMSLREKLVSRRQSRDAAAVRVDRHPSPDRPQASTVASSSARQPVVTSPKSGPSISPTR